MDWFKEYTSEFETAVAAGVKSRVLGAVKPVPVAAGKLQKRRIGQVLGTEIATQEVLVIDYYGYMKKSSGFWDLVRDIMEDQKGKQLRIVEAPLVHFNSIKLEVLAKIAPGIVAAFGDFKKAVLDAREFNHSYKA